MDGKHYHIGLLNKIWLICDENKIYYYTRIYTECFQLICYENEKIMKMLRKMFDDQNFVEIDEGVIEHTVVKQLNKDGSRWEGDWYDDKPFGFGSVYDGEGNRVYSGFMFEGKKIGFGTEYFVDNHKVDYCGHFMNDKRHGWGTTYDRNGQKLFEGDWRCGKNDFEDRIVIEDNCKEDDLRIHDLIKELEIGENCLNKWKDDFVIENYPNLQSIVVKKNSSQNLNLLKICNCEKLKSIVIENGTIEMGAFYNVSYVHIESNCFLMLVIISS